MTIKILIVKMFMIFQKKLLKKMNCLIMLDIPSYYKTRKSNDRNKDDFEMSL